MPRFFIEVAYKGTNYAGFQKQDNANTIQSELEKALKVYFRDDFQLTGSSRTDAGVHARQNYFHFDSDKVPILPEYSKISYHLNAILPPDIVVKSLLTVKEDAHCRFDALSRSYQYFLYQSKDPFLSEIAWYYPYNLDIEILRDCASQLMNHTEFETFSKRNTQVYTYNCNILSSEWTIGENTLIYNVTANRFLRGMVKAMVGTMLKMAHQKKSIDQFTEIIRSGNSSLANFAVPSHGLTLLQVNFR